jgi:hypothetical protein
MRITPTIEENIIYIPLWLNEIRNTMHSLLFNNNQQEQKEAKDKLLMLI